MLKFRPHHFMCTLGFKGMGYSDSFIDNYNIVYRQLQSEPLTEIEIVADKDIICQACPHLNYSYGCNSHKKVNAIDQKHLAALELKLGDIISWQQAKVQIKLKMTVEKFNEACEGCEWRAHGVCLQALKNL